MRKVSIQLRCLLIVGALLSCLSGTAQAAPVLPVSGTPSAPPVRVMLELDNAPAAVVYADALAGTAVSAAAATATAQSQLARIEQAQQLTMAALQALHIPVIFRTQRVYNGIAVLAPPEELPLLRNLPGVAAVHPLMAKVPDTANSVPLLGAPLLWEGYGAAGVRGEGVRIAVIDTGVDYLHVDFGGPGVGYAQNDPAVADDVPGFPGVKVVGGFDFAGDDYNADAYSPGFQPIPRPDADPMDCYGHGTHVAGIAAGFGVTQDAATYWGPYDATIDLSALRIGPGVAPYAQIYALKIFGCTGSSDLTDLAIEWAVDPNQDGDFSDRVDIINLSLGSPYGSSYDTTVVAANNAARAGVVVVASAGNSRDNFFIVGSPSVAERALSVAATQYQTAQDTGATEPGDRITSFTSRGPRRGDALLKPDLAAPGYQIVSAGSGTGSGARTLSGTSMSAPHVAGAMALLRQLHPTWSVEELKALAMNTAYPLIQSGSALDFQIYSPARIGAGRLKLADAARSSVVAHSARPAGAVSVSFGAPEVLSTFQGTQQVRVTNKGERDELLALTYAPVTDMAGVTVTLPITQLSVPAGTSTEVPLLLLADAPAMRGGHDPTLVSPGLYGRAVLGEEAGYLLLWPAGANFETALAGNGSVQATAVLTYTPAIHELSYSVELPAPKSGSFVTVTLELDQPDGDASPLYTLYAGPQTAVVTGTISFSPSHELWLAAGALAMRVELPEAGPATSYGTVEAISPVLQLPVYAAPRAVSAMHVADAALNFGNDAATPQYMSLAGTGLAGALPPADVVSLASAVQIQLSSPNSRPASLPELATDHFDAADIQYVGVATDFPNAGTMIYFAVATYAPWSTPNEIEINIFLDVDNDGTDDFRLYNSNQDGYLNEFLTSDSYVSVLQDLRTKARDVQAPLNALSPLEQDTRPFFSRVMLLPVRIADLGLTAGQSTFSYYVKTYSLDLGELEEDVVDVTPPARFDIANPAFDVSDGMAGPPIDEDVPGTSLPVRLGLRGYWLQEPESLLVFHFHNASEEQIETVPAHYQWPVNLYFPLIRNAE
ncbi:MAG: S8 family serine peptidase [Caldilineaceae bacterium]|nr:S8 family serine peptidase [Caldilineaceae bacterium]